MRYLDEMKRVLSSLKLMLLSPSLRLIPGQERLHFTLDIEYGKSLIFGTRINGIRDISGWDVGYSDPP